MMMYPHVFGEVGLLAQNVFGEELGVEVVEEDGVADKDGQLVLAEMHSVQHLVDAQVHPAVQVCGRCLSNP